MKNQKTNKAVKTATMLNGFKFPKSRNEIDQVIKAFLTGKTDGVFGRYAIVGDMLLYKTVVTDQLAVLRHGYGISSDDTTDAIKALERLISDAQSHQIDLVSHSLERLQEYLTALQGHSEIEHYNRISAVKFRTVKANLIAKRINPTTYIGNSSVLGLIGRTVAFGNESLNREETEIQRKLSTFIPMIPFTVFSEAGLDLDQYKLLDRGASENVTRYTEKFNSKTNEYDKIPETVHFTGASLFSVDGRTYLFDIDRREIALGIFNPFLAEIPVKVSTIPEAYNALKPAEVIESENDGLKVLRQGEWFFIPVKGNFTADVNPNYDASQPINTWTNAKFTVGVLQAGENRPNEVSLFNSQNNLFSGEVTHSGREHAPLKLKGWFRAVPNTATKSFTITGDID